MLGQKGEEVGVTCHMSWLIEGLGQNLLDEPFLSFVSHAGFHLHVCMYKRYSHLVVAPILTL